MSRLKVQFVETVLRDAHQSLMGTRLSYDDFKDSLELLDEAGYKAIECWGGATFDACIRYLDEDPWERIRLIKSKFKNTKTQMLLRGQNLLGYKNYPDDVVRKFIEVSIKNGIDIIRVFDALNDTRNLETSITAIKEFGAEAQVAIAYTKSPVHSTDYYIELTKDIIDMGADSIAIKDMSGILTPYDCYELVRRIKQFTDLDVEIHSHCTTGMAEMTYLKAIEAGVNIVDTAISPFSTGTSQPATETIHFLLKERGIDSGLNVDKLEELADFYNGIKNKYLENGLMPTKVLATNPKGLIYQVPGGMLSNLYLQLKDLNKLDLFDKVMEEIPEVRKDLGYPPLVTPMSQMVGTQSLFNIVTGGRYKMVPNEIKDYIKGKYGKSPAKIDEEFIHSVIGDAKDIIQDRPANHLENIYEKTKEEVKDFAKTDEDILTYLMFPEEGKKFLLERDNK